MEVLGRVGLCNLTSSRLVLLCSQGGNQASSVRQGASARDSPQRGLGAGSRYRPPVPQTPSTKVGLARSWTSHAEQPSAHFPNKVAGILYRVWKWGAGGRVMLGEGLACSCSESLSGLAELGLQDRAWPACRAATSSIQQVPSAPGGDMGRAGGGEPDSLPPSQRSLGRPRLSPTHFRSHSQDRQQSPCF